MRRASFIFMLGMGFLLSWSMVGADDGFYVIPVVRYEAVGDATVEDVLEGKTFSNAETIGLEGSMPNVGKQDITPGTAAQTISQGYHDGTGQVGGDANLIGTNIKSSVAIFGVVGSVIESTGDAAEGEVLAGKIFSRSGAAGLTGTMPNRGAVTYTPGTTDQPVAAGYHNGLGVVHGDAELISANIKSEANIFGVAGKTEVVDTTEATNPVTATRMKTGDVAFVNGNRITGSGTQTLSVLTTTVSAGYYEATSLDAVDGDLSSANIKCGVTIFGVTGTLLPGCVARTGQTTSYETGDDGDHQMGCDPAVSPLSGPDFANYNRTSIPCSAEFYDKGEGTVTDNLTGLVWLKNANCFGLKSWTDALSAANSLASGSCGLTDGSSAGDWRLPNINELRSLFDPVLSSPYLPAGHPFTGVVSSYYWSSTTVGGLPHLSWFVTLDDGYVYAFDKANSYFVWPVRGGQ